MNTTNILKGTGKLKDATLKLLRGGFFPQFVSLRLDNDKDGEFVYIRCEEETPGEMKEAIKKKLSELLGFEPRMKIEEGSRISTLPGRFSEADLRYFRRQERENKRKRKTKKKK